MYYDPPYPPPHQAIDSEKSIKYFDSHKLVSVIVKTFLRPACLQTFLESIVCYEHSYPDCLYEVIITDDSDDSTQTKNKAIVEQIQKKTLSVLFNYYPYSFDTLGVCQGRNEALSQVKTPYFLLCDDDYILSASVCLSDLIKNYFTNRTDIDILGGYVKNLKECPRSLEDLEKHTHTPFNWLGFFNFNIQPPVCYMHTYEMPDFCKADVVTFFFLARTEKVKTLGWNPHYKNKGEHNEFFQRAYQQGVQVYFSNTLWCFHYHPRIAQKYHHFRHRPSSVSSKEILMNLYIFQKISFGKKTLTLLNIDYGLRKKSELFIKIPFKINFILLGRCIAYLRLPYKLWKKIRQNVKISS